MGEQKPFQPEGATQICVNRYIYFWVDRRQSWYTTRQCYRITPILRLQVTVKKQQYMNVRMHRPYTWLLKYLPDKYEVLPVATVGIRAPEQYPNPVPKGQALIN